jgi:hypothetical protein
MARRVFRELGYDDHVRQSMTVYKAYLRNHTEYTD